MSTAESVQVLVEYGRRLDAVHAQGEIKLASQIEMVDLADRSARDAG